jgi:hypothetical protein
VKKVLLLIVTAAGAFLVWRRVSEDRADRDLWAEITDTVE